MAFPEKVQFYRVIPGTRRSRAEFSGSEVNEMRQRVLIRAGGASASHPFEHVIWSYRETSGKGSVSAVLGDRERVRSSISIPNSGLHQLEQILQQQFRLNRE